VQIKVYDTFSGQVIDNLDKACRLGKEIKNYACVMKSHPFKQNILLACFDGGISILYDIQSMQIIQEIIEYGIYSIDQFTMNNAVDVDFSQDGDYIAFSSIYGTLSLYSTQHHKQV
jgi:WD40 repeat protein